MIKTGYDLDGVLAVSVKRNKSIFQQNSEERKTFNKIRKFYYENSPCLIFPETEFYIITGRKENLRAGTEAWVKKNNLPCAGIYFLQENRTRENMIKHKSYWINKLELEQYFEDDTKLVEGLKPLCKKTNIILVPQTEESVIIAK